MSRVLLVHGWGFDATLWDGVRAVLPPGLEVQAVDLGFLGVPSGLPDTPPDLAVGHSLGGLWLMLERPDLAVRLLLVNGFTRFTAAGNFAEGVAPRMVERMIRRLDDDPAGVVDAFRERCGAAPAPGVPDRERLARGLELLLDGDARTLPPPPLALAGTADPIVAPPMTRALFDTTALGWLDGGHLLPLTHPRAVADAIVEALP